MELLNQVIDKKNDEICKFATHSLSASQIIYSAEAFIRNLVQNQVHYVES